MQKKSSESPATPTSSSERNRSIPRITDVVANIEFRGLWLAEALSIAGDQLAKVALAIMVYDRTDSALWAALVYAMTFLPALAGGLGLAQLADRFPRRTLLVGAALVQAGLVAAMTLPGMPLVLLCALVFLVSLVSAPANAAQNASAREAFDDDAFYLRSQDLRGITMNLMMLLGLAGGGMLVTLIGTRAALAIDAATFVIAAWLLYTHVQWRPGAGGQEHGWFDGARLMASDRKLRVLLGLALLVGLTVVPEGLAAPLADQLGAPDHAVGLLLAADPLGFVIGTFVLSHYVPAHVRLRLIGPLAIASCAVLIAFVTQPSMPFALALLALSGATGAYIITVIATVNTSVPNDVRGSVIGFGNASLRVVQGLGVALGGAVAEGLGSASHTVAAAGALGLVLAVLLAVSWWQLSKTPRHEPAP
ncbi:MFS transporter [Haloechinothrix salitolerans]|uniref:MFS transporter n=1 Tax=Haloechinothrix salitolerans TaxID=926830 RepID=A0ABW2C6R5_9PSEU